MKRKTVVLFAPIEILICAMYGAWTGAIDGWENTKSAWKSASRLRS